MQSMTGFGRAQQVVGGMNITVEIRSVNHRYYEYSSRLPRAYAFLDEQLKPYIQRRVSRGKVDLSVWVERPEDDADTVRVNRALAKGYLTAMRQLADELGLKDDVTAVQLARLPDVLIVERVEKDEETVWQAVRTVTDEALDRFVAMREREGEALKADVASRAVTLLGYVEQVEKQSPQTVALHMEKVRARMRELLGDVAVDEARLLNEAAVFADKIAVAEETVRLRSHIDQLNTMLNSREPVGRKLDFLLQELNREANTIGSKVQNLELARVVVEMKAELEKIREQIQNIE